MQAMPQAPQLIPACSTFSSLLIVLTHNTKNRLHYTLNTLHQTLHNTLTIHSKHAICHKSLNSQNLLSLSLSPTRHCCCHSSADVPPTTSHSSTIYPKSGFGRAGASGPSTRQVGRVGWLATSSQLHTNIHRFQFHFVVSTFPDLLRPEQTWSGLV